MTPPIVCPAGHKALETYKEARILKLMPQVIIKGNINNARRRWLAPNPS